MKINLFFIIFIGTYFIQLFCDELKASEKDSIIKLLNGKWDWIRTINYNGGTDYGPNDIGITQYWNFFQDTDDSLMQMLSFEKYRDDTLIFSGKTSLSKTFVFGDYIWKFDSIAYFGYEHFRINNYDSLIFICGGCADGSIVYYIKNLPIPEKQNINDNGFSFIFYPNPAKDIITITAYYTLPATFRVYDITRKITVEKKLTSHYEKLTIHDLPLGIFIYEFTDGSGNCLRGKLAVE